MGEHVNRILCVADPKRSPESIDTLLAAAGQHGGDAIAVVGDIGGDGDGEREVFRALGHATCPSCPVFWVAGAGDAPVERYVREAFNIEAAFPRLRGVHGTGASTSGGVAFAGMGGDRPPARGRGQRGRDDLPPVPRDDARSERGAFARVAIAEHRRPRLPAARRPRALTSRRLTSSRSRPSWRRSDATTSKSRPPLAVWASSPARLPFAGT